MPLIAPAAAGHIDDAGRVAEFGLEEVTLNLELLDGIERRVDGGIAHAWVANLGTIIKIAGGTLPLAAHINRAVGAASCLGHKTLICTRTRLGVRNLWHNPRRQRTQCQVIAA